MAPRCKYCDKLTISHLVVLAKEECAGWAFPQRSFYRHHESVQYLKDSALAGCDLCSLILQRLQKTSSTISERVWSDTWDGADCALEDSVFSAAMQRPSSDMKLVIARWSPEGSMLTRVARWETVQTLDQLWIQVGPSEAADADDSDASSETELVSRTSPLPIVHLKITTSSRQPLLLDGIKIGRWRVDPDIAAESNFAIARRWLQECQSSHIECLREFVPTLPTRVLDVEAGKNPDDVRILCTHGEKAQYIALSHCWGGPISPVLTSKNLEEFQNAFAMRNLPANFRDAVTITRKLGIRYLWIDSLCIMQDSTSDWEQESKKMGTIYRDATVTLSASASRGSQDGIFKCRSAPDSTAHLSALLKVSGESAIVSEVRVEAEDIEDLRQLDTSGPLAIRGWCLQESILSPRQLFFGRQQIYWRCPAGYVAADGTTSGSSIPIANLPTLSKHLHSDLLRETSAGDRSDSSTFIDLLVDYYDLLQRYSQRKLTYGSDKLPAWSGIAQRFHSAVGGDYIAGVWSSDLANSLLWGFDSRGGTHVLKYRAPSWSWAVTDDYLHFLFNALNVDLKTTGTTVQLVEYETVLRDSSNPYGEVEYAHLILRGLVVPFIWKHSTSRHDLDDNVGSINWDESPPFQVSTEPDATHLVLRGGEDGLAYNLYMDHTEGRLFLRKVTDGGSAGLLSEPTVLRGEDHTFLAVVVHMDCEVGDKIGRYARGLLLRLVVSQYDGTPDVFERAGTFSLRLKDEAYGNFVEKVVKII